MRANLLQVTVIQLPNRIEAYSTCLDRGRWFEQLEYSSEDEQRTDRYRANRAPAECSVKHLLWVTF